MLSLFPPWSVWIPRWLAAVFDQVAAEAEAEAEEELEVAWLRQVAAGDERGMQPLFDRWKLPLISFFYRSLGSHADAEDLTLEVFVRLHRAAASYRPQAKFSTYLFQIAHNLLRNELRRRRRKPADLVPPETFDYAVEAESGSGRRLAEMEEVFQRALDRLPEKYRTPLLLLHQQHLSPREAAGALGVTENSLRVLLHRGRQQLKTEMEALS